MKKLIIGNGKVARIIRDKNTIVVPRQGCDIRDEQSIEKVIQRTQPDILINCAAKTNLEYCQENKIEAFNVNTQGTINCLLACEKHRIKFVHISSGCLFDGNHFIADEMTVASPSVWYTHTKNWADEYIKNYGYKSYLILRPRQLISAVPHPTNMLTKFSNFEMIEAIDEDNSVTCIEDFADMINHLIAQDATGIFNCSNTGTLTPYEIASRIRDTISPSLVVKKTSYKNLLQFLPNRRVNTVLSNHKLISTGYTPRHASEALEWCLKNYGK